MKYTWSLFFVLLCIRPIDAQWTPANGPGESKGISTIASDSSFLFAGTYMGVMRSSDRGMIWHPVLRAQSISTILADHSTIFAGGEYGLFRSLDYGSNWEAIDSLLPSQYNIAQLLGTASDLYVVDEGAVLHSIDTGRTWRPIGSAPTDPWEDTTVRHLAVLGPHFLIGTNGYGLLRSSDSGSTWHTVTNGLPMIDYPWGFFTGSQEVFMFCTDGVFRSTDSGASWTEADSGLNAGVLNMAELHDTLFVGTNALSIFFSTNRGRSWLPRNAQGPHLERTITALAAAEDFLLCARINSMYISTNSGLLWVDRSNGLSTENIQCIRAINGRLFASGGDLGLRYSDDGLTWGPDSGLAGSSAIIQAGSTIITTGPPVNWSSDGGYTWYPSTRDSHLGGVFCFGTLDSIVFAGSYRGVERSTDFGRRWILTSGPGQTYSLGSFDGMLFAGTYDSGIYRSSDAGQWWTRSNSAAMVSDVRAIEHSDHSVFAGDDTYGGVYRSRDLGLTWNLAAGSMPQDSFGHYPYVTALLTKGDTVFAGGDGVFESTDDGETWRDVSDGLPASTVQSLAIFAEYLYAATQDYAVWRRPLSELGLHAGVKQSGASGLSLTVSPNPASDQVSLSFTLDEPSRCRIDVYDVSGRHVDQAINRILGAGRQEVLWLPRSTPSGVYTLVIAVGESWTTAQLVLSRTRE